MRARAFLPEYRHRHYRDDGRGFVEHWHAVTAERHGHAALGLRLTRLTWIAWRWDRFVGVAVNLLGVFAWVVITAIALVGWAKFAGVI